jgi:hypothetical protein
MDIETLNTKLGFDKPNEDYQFFKIKCHYTSTDLSWRSKQNVPAESLLLPVETVPHPTRLESGTSKLSFRFFLTTYN